MFRLQRSVSVWKLPAVPIEWYNHFWDTIEIFATFINGFIIINLINLMCWKFYSKLNVQPSGEKLHLKYWERFITRIPTIQYVHYLHMYNNYLQGYWIRCAISALRLTYWLIRRTCQKRLCWRSRKRRNNCLHSRRDQLNRDFCCNA